MLPSEQDLVALAAVVSDVLSAALLLHRDRGFSASIPQGIPCRELIVTMSAEHHKE